MGKMRNDAGWGAAIVKHMFLDKRNNKTGKVISIFLLLLTVATALWPLTARADGGPVVPTALYTQLKEGQQIAVVTINDLESVSVDLFVSILDQTGESHEISYFVPLGTNASGLSVMETDSMSFSGTLLDELDGAIFAYGNQSRDFADYLFAGALLTNGAWLTPLWLPVLLTGCGSTPMAPTASFTTASSEVSVFGIDESTDVAALAATAGLDPSVTGALDRVRGQQIAVVKLHTAPASSGGGTGGEGASGEPGLYLSWNTALTPGKSGPAYAYPLSTGAAWASPIEMTRVYVVAPPDLHFSVKYPKLGANRPGLRVEGGRYVPVIADSGETPAYAAEFAANQMTSTRYPAMPRRVTVWRGTYANSNADEDIIITVKKGPALGALGTRLRQAGPMEAFLFGLLVAAVLWMLAWFLLMPRLLGAEARGWGLWQFSLFYLAWNLLLFVPGAFFFLVSTMGAQNHLDGLVVTVPLFALASAFVTFRLATHVGRWRALKSVGIVTIASGGAYVLFVLGFLKLAGAA